MKRIITLLILISFAVTGNSFAQLMPKPMHAEIKKGHFASPPQPSKIIKNNMKSDNSGKWVWDTMLLYVSLDAVNKYMYIRTFDYFGNLLSKNEKLWKESGWEDELMLNYTYDAEGNMLSKEGKYYYGGSWYNKWRDLYTYDENGNKLTMICEIEENNNWKTYYKINYKYETNGNLTEILYENKSEDNIWHPMNKSTYAYDNQGNEIMRLEQYMLEDGWINSYKSTAKFDTNGKLLYWDDSVWKNNEWHLNYYSSYLYNENNLCTEMKSESFMCGHSIFTINYNYDTNARLIEERHNDKCLDTTHEPYERSWNYYYSYDSIGKQISKRSTMLQDSIWTNYEKTIYIYNTAGNMEHEMFGYYKGDKWDSISLFSYEYDKYGNSLKGKYETWDNEFVNTYYNEFMYVFSKNEAVEQVDGFQYEITWKQINNVNEQFRKKNEELTIYPNPAASYVNIQNLNNTEKYRLQVKNIEGKLFITKDIENNSLYELNISNLSNGLYFLFVFNENGNSVKKLMIQR